jgi:hypothetical protein
VLVDTVIRARHARPPTGGKLLAIALDAMPPRYYQVALRDE